MVMRWQKLTDEEILKENQEAEEFTERLYVTLFRKKETTETSAEHAAPPREKGLLENFLADVKAQTSAVKSEQPVDAGNIAKFAYKNKDKIKKEAIDKLETLEELVTVFNDAYHKSKFKAVDEVLEKEDYVDDLKNNLMKIVGMDKISDGEELSKAPEQSIQKDKEKGQKESSENATKESTKT